MAKTTLKFGWCMDGHDESCPETVGQLVCKCECHERISE